MSRGTLRRRPPPPTAQLKELVGPVPVSGKDLKWTGILEPYDEDYDRVQLYELRKRAEEMAQDLDLVFDDDFAALIGELVDNLRAARDEDGEIIAFDNG